MTIVLFLLELWFFMTIMIVFGWVEICSKMQKKFGQHIILLIYSSILELKFPAPYLNFWAWHCLFDLVGVALKTMEISSQTQQLHCTVVQKWIDYSAISDISSNGIKFRLSKKAKKYETIFHLIRCLLSKYQIKWKIV